MPNPAPLGIYDSGVGGLTVWKSLRQRLPGEKVIYFADTAHVPYGGKSGDEIVQLSTDIVHFLTAEGVKLIVAACNTSSALALPRLTQTSVPLVGMIEPVVKQTVGVTRTGMVGLLATEATVDSGVHREVFRRSAPEITLFSQACPRLVPLIEAGCTWGPLLTEAVREYVEPLLSASVDSIILGCTPYPLVAETIQAVAGPDVTLIDPAHGVARRVSSLLAQRRWANPEARGEDRIFVSGDPQSFALAMATLGFASEAKVQQADASAVDMKSTRR